jgi:hypothetical protein
LSFVAFVLTSFTVTLASSRAKINEISPRISNPPPDRVADDAAARDVSDGGRNGDGADVVVSKEVTPRADLFSREGCEFPKRKRCFRRRGMKRADAKWAEKPEPLSAGVP